MGQKEGKPEEGLSMSWVLPWQEGWGPAQGPVPSEAKTIPLIFLSTEY